MKLKWYAVFLVLLFALVSWVYSAGNRKIDRLDKVIKKYYEVYNTTRPIPSGLRRHILRYKIKPLEHKRRIEERSANKKRLRGINRDKQIKDKGDKALSVSGLTFKNGEMYCYPNPAKGIKPRFHIEVGEADRVDIEIYDITGRKIEAKSISGSPDIIDDGQGPEYAYEYEWDVSGIGSGIYIVYVKAYSKGSRIEGSFKCGVVK